MIKNKVFDLVVQGQGPTDLILICNTPHPHTCTYTYKL